ncbi:MAG TPA: MBL fold metallo-hydrolase [Chloroflexota bacterium]|nr:MBL fold metallo-hydrolase [Chloroflexota bacterium]
MVTAVAPPVPIVAAEERVVAKAALALPAVDAVQITLLMDNTIDILMAGSAVARRLPLGPNPFERPQPIAEHGFSALIEVRLGGKKGTVLFDTGVSRTGILHNLDVMEIDARDIQALILSHGHADHAMGLPGLVDRLGPRGLPLTLHPDAYLERRLMLPNGETVAIPAPRLSDLRRENIEIIEEVGPSMLVDGMVLVSGEVARVTPFETGFSIHQARRAGVWEADPLIMDDQCAIINVRDHGLVIVTGCGHSGIINIIRNAQALTGIRSVYAVVGGFHLSGALFESRIPATVAAMQAIGPRYLMPGHCTGWVASHQLARALPDAYIANSVGTTLIL